MQALIALLATSLPLDALAQENGVAPDVGNEVLLFWIVGAGAFGGLVDGLIVKHTYKLKIPYLSRKEEGETPRWSHVELGFVGDILVGATASIAVFVVAGGLFNVNLQEFFTAGETYVRVLALGVLSGFAGIRLLRGLSEKMVEEIATKAAKETYEKKGRLDSEAAINLRMGDRLLGEYDGWCASENIENEPLSEENLKEHLKKLDDVLARYQLVLQTAPEHEDALRQRSRVFRRMAIAYESAGKSVEAEKSWKNAMHGLNQVLENNPDSGYTYYMRACYRIKKGEDIDGAIEDFRQALSVSRTFKEMAERDPDFDSVRANPEFRALMK